MKKLMTFAVMTALILAAGCAKIESKSTTNDVQHAIGFSNYAPKSLTKADDSYASSTTLIVDKKFDVVAYATANSTAFSTTAIGTKFMDKVPVTYGDGGNTTATANTYSPLRYWPSGDSPQWLTFWAYYPDQANNGISYTLPNGLSEGNNGIGSFSFTAAATANKMVDFMVADVVNDKIYGTSAGDHIAVNGVVQLIFKHQLTKIGFTFNTDIDPDDDPCTKVVLTDAKLYNVRTQGTLTTSYATGTTTTDWGTSATLVDSNSDGVGDTVYEITIDGADISNKVLGLSPVGEAAADLFLMIPQNMDNAGTDAHKVVLNWSVKTFDTEDHATDYGATETTVGNNGLLSITNNTATILLANVTVKNSSSETVSNNWAKNQFTTYAITIGPKPIRFTATVTPWDAETTGAISVN